MVTSLALDGYENPHRGYSNYTPGWLDEGTFDGVWTRIWDGSVWSDWQGLGGAIADDPDSVSSAGRTFVFARGADNRVWYRKRDGGAWSNWEGLGSSTTSEPVVTSR